MTVVSNLNCAGKIVSEIGLRVTLFSIMVHLSFRGWSEIFCLMFHDSCNIGLIQTGQCICVFTRALIWPGRCVGKVLQLNCFSDRREKRIVSVLMMWANLFAHQDPTICRSFHAVLQLSLEGSNIWVCYCACSRPNAHFRHIFEEIAAIHWASNKETWTTEVLCRS